MSTLSDAHGEGKGQGPVLGDRSYPPPPSNPMEVARYFLETAGMHRDGVLTLRWWRENFYGWTGSHWTEIGRDAIEARLYSALEAVEYLKETKGGEFELVPWRPTRVKVGNVAHALQAVAYLPAEIEAPNWTAGINFYSNDDLASPGPFGYHRDDLEDGAKLAEGLLAFSNTLLYLDDRRTKDHDPCLFNLFALPYDYFPDPPKPLDWLAFLDTLWPEDEDSVRLLQEWIGYVISGRTDLHKIALLVGPPRSGKGTVARVLTALIGRQNVAGPTLASLASNFGLEPLVGKPLAVVADARLSSGSSTVVERLLSISGEDTLSVDRKFRPAWIGRIPSRFLVLSNELPNLGDASGAMANRFVVLNLTRSWLGREDTELTERLLAELPGILAWGLEGLDRLERQGRFTEPASSRDAITTLLDLTSPIGAFLRERCQQGPGQRVACEVLYRAWRQWCMDNGRDRPGTLQRFGRDLRAAAPALSVGHPRIDGKQVRHYEGIALKSGETKKE